MNTLRLPALPRNERLEWGSTDWAAHSCLADWAELERQWLGVEEHKSAQDGARHRLRKRFVAALLGAAVLAIGCTPSLRREFLAMSEVLSPAIAALAELLPHAALGLGLLVLAGVALGLWREPGEPARSVEPQPPSRAGAG